MSNRILAGGHRLISYRMLMSFVLCLIVSLALLFYQQQRLERVIESAQPDHLSVAYLRLLAYVNPGNSDLTLRLAQQQEQLGQWEQAIATLQPLISRPGTLPARAHLFSIKLRLRQLHACNEACETLGSAVSAELAGLLERQPLLQPEELEQAARASLELKRSDLAGGFFHLAFIADPGADNAASYALLSLQALRAARQERLALKRALQYLEYQPGQRELLERGIEIALAVEQPGVALQLGWRRLALEPHDLGQILRQAERALAAGDDEAAFRLMQHVVELHPHAPGGRQRLIQLAGWLNRPAVALEQWLWLLNHQRHQPADLEEALQLARALQDDAARSRVLSLLTMHRPLRQEELEEMLAASERSGQSVGNIAFLKNYLERYPQQAKAWMLLAQAQEALGQPRAAAASWEAFEDRVGPTSTTRRQRALLLWRAGARRQALALLEASRPLATRQDQAFWALLGDQAWTLGALQPALAAYRLLHESDRTDLLALERLMLLSHQAGQRQTAVRLAAAGFRQSRQPRFLLFGLDLAFQATRWDEMQELFALASSSEGLFRNDEAYWMLKAHMLVHVGDRPGAIAAYENALVAAPRSTAARLGLLWLLIDLDDRLRLSELLARWEADASEDSAYWGVYGVALMRLQRPREAVVWLERLVRAKPEELPLLLNLADSLREAGREQDAWWLRQYVAAQVRGELHHGQ